MNPINRYLCIAALFLALAGCDKEHQGGGTVPNAVTVALAGSDIAPDGGFSEQGLQKLSAVPADKPMALSVVRSKIGDKALIQLSKYSNLKSLEAVGSPLSQKGIEQLKAKLPTVQITK